MGIAPSRRSFSPFSQLKTPPFRTPGRVAVNEMRQARESSQLSKVAFASVATYIIREDRLKAVRFTIKIDGYIATKERTVVGYEQGISDRQV